jgi:ribose transport system permease protein
MPPTKSHSQLLLGKFLQQYGLLLMVALLVLVFTFLNQRFLTPNNFINILEQNGALAIISVGVTFSIISGNFDLSTGAVVALSGVVLALVFINTNSILLAVIAALCNALLVGVFNVFLIAYMKINSVIVTLACMIWARGIALRLTNADSIPFKNSFIDSMTTSSFLGISPIIWMIIFSFLIGWFILNRTRLGRYTYAMGGDIEATKQAGVDTSLYTLLIFSLSAVMVWLGTIVTVSRLSAGVPNAVFGLEFDAIVAVIIGGNNMSGGEGNLRKTLIGLLFIAILNNGLSTLGMRDSMFYLFKGLIILVALFFEVVSRHMLKGANSNTIAGNGSTG